jgi:hypothetical protein
MSASKTHKRSGLHEIRWTKEIPPKPPSRNLYNQQAEQLREKPDKWALVAECPSKTAAYGAAFSRKRKWGPEYEIAVREHEVYARFVGKKGTSVKTQRTAAKRSNKGKARRSARRPKQMDKETQANGQTAIDAG